jgi:hypothetical protein
MSTNVYVYTLNAGKGKWSRYVFPFSIEAFAQLGDDLYIRHGDYVSRVVEGIDTDDVAGDPTNFAGLVQWAWLDFGRPGVTKMLEGFDYVGEGQAPRVAFGYDQRNVAALTPPYLIPNDTLSGGMIPMPISAPTMSVRLAFDGGQAWRVNSVQLYVADDRAGA